MASVGHKRAGSGPPSTPVAGDTNILNVYRDSDGVEHGVRAHDITNNASSLEQYYDTIAGEPLVPAPPSTRRLSLSIPSTTADDIQRHKFLTLTPAPSSYASRSLRDERPLVSSSAGAPAPTRRATLRLDVPGQAATDADDIILEGKPDGRKGGIDVGNVEETEDHYEAVSGTQQPAQALWQGRATITKDHLHVHAPIGTGGPHQRISSAATRKSLAASTTRDSWERGARPLREKSEGGRRSRVLWCGVFVVITTIIALALAFYALFSASELNSSHTSSEQAAQAALSESPRAMDARLIAINDSMLGVGDALLSSQLQNSLIWDPISDCATNITALQTTASMAAQSHARLVDAASSMSQTASAGEIAHNALISMQVAAAVQSANATMGLVARSLTATAQIQALASYSTDMTSFSLAIQSISSSAASSLSLARDAFPSSLQTAISAPYAQLAAAFPPGLSARLSQRASIAAQSSSSLAFIAQSLSSVVAGLAATTAQQIQQTSYISSLSSNLQVLSSAAADGSRVRSSLSSSVQAQSSSIAALSSWLNAKTSIPTSISSVLTSPAFIAVFDYRSYGASFQYNNVSARCPSGSSPVFTPLQFYMASGNTVCANKIPINPSRACKAVRYYGVSLARFVISAPEWDIPCTQTPPSARPFPYWPFASFGTYGLGFAHPNDWIGPNTYVVCCA